VGAAAKAAPGAALRGVGRAALAGAKSAAQNPRLWGTLGAMAAHAAGVPGAALLAHAAGSKGVAPAIGHALDGGGGGGRGTAAANVAKGYLPSARVRQRAQTPGQGASTVDPALQRQAQAGARARGGTGALKPPPGLSGPELRAHHSDGLGRTMKSGDDEAIAYHAGEINKLNK
jgi:hypothetical protein